MAFPGLPKYKPLIEDCGKGVKRAGMAIQDFEKWAASQAPELVPRIRRTHQALDVSFAELKQLYGEIDVLLNQVGGPDVEKGKGQDSEKGQSQD